MGHLHVLARLNGGPRIFSSPSALPVNGTTAPRLLPTQTVNQGRTVAQISQPIPLASSSLPTLLSCFKPFQLFQSPVLAICTSCQGSKPSAATTAQPSAPASKNSLALAGASAVERVLEAVRFIEKRLKTSVYNHTTKIDIAKGQFEFDCSGMVNWMLQQAAPTAYSELKSERPRVAEYVKVLKAIPYDKPSAGWRRVKKIADAEPGDVIAWPTPDWYPSDATGHMGVVVAKPEKVSGGYLIRIADATSLPHGEDSREGGTGFGYGSILVTVDPDTGIGTGQGWTGRYSANTVIKTPIYVGRPLK